MLNLVNQVGVISKDEREQFERIDNQNEIANSKGMFFISEKAKRGQLDLTDDFFNTTSRFIERH
jgi:hypothetical protein